MAKQTTENTTRRLFIGGVTGALAASLVPATAQEASEFERTAYNLTQMSGFMRPYVAEQIGVSVETLNQWIASPDEETQELIVNAAVSLGEQAKAELERRAAGGAS